MIRWLAVAVVAVLASACGSAVDETTRSSAGVIVEPGRLGLGHLRPGDCIRDALADEVEVMIGVPCDRDHHGQVVSIGRDEEFDLDDPRSIDELCTIPVEEIGRRLLTRPDLPRIDVALLFAKDGSRVACILEFEESIREDLVRTAT